MKILVVGSGGREHALAWRIGRSARVSQVLCAPGNGGTGQVGVNVAVSADDVDGLVSLATDREVDLVVVGPEAPLVAGLADRLDAAGVPCLGPPAAAARMEGSKAFAKDIMLRAGVPTARHEVFDDAAAAAAYVERVGAPIVVKADGLAAGKGVVVATTVEQAREAIDSMMEQGRFGEAGDTVVIEEYLDGVESSYMVLTDGHTLIPLATSKDHKRLLDGDGGPNTGGMGAVSPSPAMGDAETTQALASVIAPVLKTLAADGIDYRGFLYAGLMLTSDGPKVLEFNCRLGDPETQPIVMRLEGDPVPALYAAAAGQLAGHGLDWSRASACCVVMASGGYPAAYEQGYRIDGLAGADALANVQVFHAGTRRDPDTHAVHTSGGRVLGVTATGFAQAEAVARAYEAVARISFTDAVHRRDIGR